METSEKKDMLNIEHLTIQYGTNSPVVHDFSLSMKQGEIVGIVGESGSGKSTVIKAILGSLPESAKLRSGSIRFQEKELISCRSREWEQLRGRRIALISQDCGLALNPLRKISSQFVEYIRTHEAMSRKEAWRLGCEMLQKMRLEPGEELMNRYPHQLSGGQRQRVGIAMAMTFQPELLLADEPTSALDVTTQAEIVSQMLTLREEYHTSILLVTHNLGVASHMSDQLVVMQQGSIADQGSCERVLMQPQSNYTRELLAAVPNMEGSRLV